MIDERIVALAKEFHELVGCSISVLSKGRWYIDSNTRRLELWNQEDMDIPEWMQKRNIERTTIPILDESKLWAWLKEHIFSVEISDTRITIILTNPYRDEDVLRIDIENTLHAALYAACIAVAKERKHDNV